MSCPDAADGTRAIMLSGPWGSWRTRRLRSETSRNRGPATGSRRRVDEWQRPCVWRLSSWSTRTTLTPTSREIARRAVLGRDPRTSCAALSRAPWACEQVACAGGLSPFFVKCPNSTGWHVARLDAGGGANVPFRRRALPPSRPRRVGLRSTRSRFGAATANGGAYCFGFADHSAADRLEALNRRIVANHLVPLVTSVRSRQPLPRGHEEGSSTARCRGGCPSAHGRCRRRGAAPRGEVSVRSHRHAQRLPDRAPAP